MAKFLQESNASKVKSVFQVTQTVTLWTAFSLKAKMGKTLWGLKKKKKSHVSSGVNTGIDLKSYLSDTQLKVSSA